MVFSKMLAKGMQLIEFENCNFFNFWRGNSPSEAPERKLPLRHLLFKLSKINISSDKGIKTGKVGGSSDMIMYPIPWKIFLVKCYQKTRTKSRELSFKNAIF